MPNSRRGRNAIGSVSIDWPIRCDPMPALARLSRMKLDSAHTSSNVRSFSAHAAG